MKILLIIDVLLVAYRIIRTIYVRGNMRNSIEYMINYRNSMMSIVDAILGIEMFILILVTIIVGIIKIF